MLPSEMFRQKCKTFYMRISNLILPKQCEEMESNAELTRFLRRKTYVLANMYGKKIESKPIRSNLFFGRVVRSLKRSFRPYLLI